MQSKRTDCKETKLSSGQFRRSRRLSKKSLSAEDALSERKRYSVKKRHRRKTGRFECSTCHGRQKVLLHMHLSRRFGALAVESWDRAARTIRHAFLISKRNEVSNDPLLRTQHL